MIESILEAIEKTLQEGKISWGMIITALILFNKIQRNKEFRERDKRVENRQMRIEFKIDEIMTRIGVVTAWKYNLAESGSRSIYRYITKYLTKKYLSERRKNMQLNYATLIPTLLAAAKIILQVFGITIPDELTNELVNGIAAVGAIIGIFMTHQNPVLSEVAATGDIMSPTAEIPVTPSVDDLKTTVSNVNKALVTLTGDLHNDNFAGSAEDVAKVYNEVRQTLIKMGVIK